MAKSNTTKKIKVYRGRRNGKYSIRCCSASVPIIVLAIFGILAVCLGAASIPTFKYLYMRTLKKELVLKEGTKSFHYWVDPPIIIYIDYYLFNYTNHDDVIRNNVKPIVQEVGPYSYRLHCIKDVLAFTPSNITFQPDCYFNFDVKTTCPTCSEDDLIYTPNIAILSIAKKIHDLNVTEDSPWYDRYTMKGIDFFLESQDSWGLFKPLEVQKLLWGYHEPFLDKVKVVEKLLEKLSWKIPKIKTHISLQKNGTAGANYIGNITVSTGKEKIEDVNRILEWRGKRVSPYWQTKYGDMINGTDGSQFKPFIERDEKLYAFVPDLCRSIYLEYQTDHKIMNIDVYRYQTTSELFASPNVNPDNAAFCSKERCWPSGVLSVGQCQEGDPPVFMSAPHFHHGDPSLVNAIVGLHPSDQMHKTFLDVEPLTGVTMEGHKKLQINFLAQRDDYLTVLQHLANEDNFLPVMWVHKRARIDKENAKKFREAVFQPKRFFRNLGCGLMILGLFLILLALVINFLWRKPHPEYTEANTLLSGPELGPSNPNVETATYEYFRDSDHFDRDEE